MARQKMSGLFKRKGLWHIDKQVDGVRIRESTGTDQFEEAERYLIHRLESLRKAAVYGVRPQRTFREAATKFLLEHQHKKSIKVDAWCLKSLDPYIGDLTLESVHIGSLQPYILARQKKGVKTKSINHALQTVRQILNLAAGVWMDEHGLTWLATLPKIKLLSERDGRKPYPLNWDEQDKLFELLPQHLQQMALFSVNTGCRDSEVCNLKWEWEVKVPIPEIGSVFIIPGERVKNSEDRLVVLNRIAKEVIDKQRGKNSEFVFVYRNKPISRMLNNGWKKARHRANLHVRVHDLKHTYGRRLRAAGVSFEDRQDLLGHKSARITTHYSSAELLNLWEASNRVCSSQDRPTLTLLRRKQQLIPTKSPHGFLKVI